MNRSSGALVASPTNSSSGVGETIVILGAGPLGSGIPGSRVKLAGIVTGAAWATEGASVDEPDDPDDPDDPDVGEPFEVGESEDDAAPADDELLLDDDPFTPLWNE